MLYLVNFPSNRAKFVDFVLITCKVIYISRKEYKCVPECSLCYILLLRFSTAVGLNCLRRKYFRSACALCSVIWNSKDMVSSWAVYVFGRSIRLSYRHELDVEPTKTHNIMFIGILFPLRLSSTVFHIIYGSSSERAVISANCFEILVSCHIGIRLE